MTGDGVDGSVEHHAQDYDTVYRGGIEHLPWEIGEAQPALVALLERAPAGPRVLDAGCGTGQLARLLARDGYEVVGLDISHLAVEVARQSAADAGLAVSFVVGDARELQRHVQGPFDTVVDSGLLHTLDHPGQARYVGGLQAVCRPGGQVHVLAMSVDAGLGWGLTTDRLSRLFASPEWGDVHIEPVEVMARIEGNVLGLPGLLLSATRAG